MAKAQSPLYYLGCGGVIAFPEQGAIAYLELERFDFIHPLQPTITQQLQKIQTGDYCC